MNSNDAAQHHTRPDAGQLRPGLVLHNRFKIRRHIATTRLNAVYNAVDLETRRQVVVKRLALGERPGGLARMSAIRMFAAEAALLESIDHPQVPRLIAAIRARGEYYLVLEYVAGTSLERLLERGLLTPALALAICRSLCQVAEALHRAGIVHADIKPNNIIVSAGGRVSLIDFGLARRIGQPPAIDEVLGTPPYAPPEQWAGAALGPRSDVYALGQVLDELFLAVHCPELRAAIAPALAPDLGQRFASVSALRRALAAALPPGREPGERLLVCDPWALAAMLALLASLAVLLLR